ncbi:MAG: hypothetical protein Q4G22_08780 [Paracoccus sp. (in: a-proteobacteria)]|uniref:hypothetical protein n=1 Tax=Paracoccus sp. TaxID=267 RepID=UPI0026DEBE08|nr:hypothetical protein [Paracoccus sp. (in: a-proteobacteria)]MDO5631919.1 hypothetical protein [Paracoccus sp. (in: a-proteobacteria)]
MTDRKEDNIVIAALRALCAVPEGVVSDNNARWAVNTGQPVAGARSAADHPDLNDYRRVMRENTLLTDHAEMLACALGACPNCWGTIPDCEDCGGVGQPGAFNPDPAMFARFVRPIIDRMAWLASDRGTRQRSGKNRPMGYSA